MLLSDRGGVRGAAQVHRFDSTRGPTLRRVSDLPTVGVEAALRAPPGQAAVCDEGAGLGEFIFTLASLCTLPVLHRMILVLLCRDIFLQCCTTLCSASVYQPEKIGGDLLCYGQRQEAWRVHNEDTHAAERGASRYKKEISTVPAGGGLTPNAFQGSSTT